MKKIVKTTGTIGTAAALSLSSAACSTPRQAPTAEPPSTATAGGADAQPGATAQATTAPQGPDCKGKDQFTEACGYASPTRYAALDPEGIRNS